MTTESIQERQDKLLRQFQDLPSWEDRYKKVIELGKALPKGDESLYDPKFLVKGCQSQVWLHASLDEQGAMKIQADSDAMIVKGLVALLVGFYSGLTPKQVLSSPANFIKEMGFQEHLSPSRANGFLAMVKQIQLYAQAFVLTQSR